MADYNPNNSKSGGKPASPQRPNTRITGAQLQLFSPETPHPDADALTRARISTTGETARHSPYGEGNKHFIGNFIGGCHSYLTFEDNTRRLFEIAQRGVVTPQDRQELGELIDTHIGTEKRRLRDTESYNHFKSAALRFLVRLADWTHTDKPVGTLADYLDPKPQPVPPGDLLPGFDDETIWNQMKPGSEFHGSFSRPEGPVISAGSEEGRRILDEHKLRKR